MRRYFCFFKKTVFILMIGFLSNISLIAEKNSFLLHEPLLVKDTLLVGEPFIVIHRLINLSSEYIKIPYWSLMRRLNYPTVIQPDGNKMRLMSQLTGLIAEPPPPEILPPHDTVLFFRDYFKEGFRMPSIPFIKPGKYQIIWRVFEEEVVKEVTVITKKEEEEAGKEFIAISYFPCEFKRFLKKYPHSKLIPYALYYYAHCPRLKAGEGIKILKKLQKEYPDFIYSSWCNCKIGVFYWEDLKNKEKAKEYFLKHIKMHPKSSGSRRLLQKMRKWGWIE